MAKKAKGNKGEKGDRASPSTAAAPTSAAARPADRALVSTAEQQFERGNYAGVRDLVPALRAEGTPEAQRTADRLWERVKVDPIPVLIGVGAAALVAAIALFTLH